MKANKNLAKLNNVKGKIYQIKKYLMKKEPKIKKCQKQNYSNKDIPNEKRTKSKDIPNEKRTKSKKYLTSLITIMSSSNLE